MGYALRESARMEGQEAAAGAARHSLYKLISSRGLLSDGGEARTLVFSSATFLFYFLPAFLVLYFSFGLSNIVLLLFSLIFYAWGEPRFLPILLIYIVLNYAAGNLIGRGGPLAKVYMICGVAGNLMLLLYFKYFNFLTAQISDLVVSFGYEPLKSPDVALPLGISFIAFQGMSYVVDVYRGTVASQQSLLKFAMYKSMFPQLIAGPIVRYSDIANDIDKRRVDVDDMATGASQFVIGLGQKVLIANILALPADQIFSATSISAPTAWLGLTCYTLQIFFDFAGYSNMAIGLGRIMGFTYPINFDRPYISQSITEFWRRWHMTLSRWFRDYLYIPLGGNRGSELRTYCNLLIVFLLCGFWHGANWTFFIWGAYHGSFLVLERVGLGAILARSWRPLRHIYTIFVVAFGWVFFRCNTLQEAITFIGDLFGQNHDPAAQPVARYLTNDVSAALCVGVVCACMSYAAWRQRVSGSLVPTTLRLSGGYAVLLCILFLSVLEIAGGAYNPFIYFRF